MRWLRRLVTSWTFAAVATVFFGAALIGLLVLEHQRLEREQDATTYLYGTNQWIVSQLEFELLRFQRSLDRYVFDTGEVSHRDLMLRFNILWSRVPVFLEGPEAARARKIEGAVQTVKKLRARLRQVESTVKSIEPGDRAARVEVLDALAPLEQPLHDINRTLGSGQWRSDLQKRHNRLERRQTWLFAGMASAAVVLVLLSLLLIRRSYRQAQQERDARLAAVGADQAKTRFLANMSHELRTPLNAVIGFAQIIRDEQFGPIGKTAYRDRAGDIYNSAQHLLAVLNDVLDLARVEADRLPLNETDFDVGDAVQRCLRMVQSEAERRQVTLQGDIPGDLPSLQADPRLVRQIVLNLATNAVKYAGQGATVTVAVRHTARGFDLAVSDDGPGIPQDYVEAVLLPFRQAEVGRQGRPSGSGLGLALAKRFVELHQGRLEIDTKEGVGTTVTAHFPAHRVVPAR